MARIKVEKNSNYTVMSNYHLKDKNMSLKSKGLLSLMLSLPDNWDYSLAGLITLSSDGDNSTRTALGELEEKGYVTRQAIRDKGKILDWEYTIYEEPQLEKPDVEKPVVENPHVENPLVENQAQLNTKELNTNLLNTKKINTKEYYIEEIAKYFEQVTGKSCSLKNQNNVKYIKARLNEGFSVEDFKSVICFKNNEWSKDPKMSKYIQPSTLFSTKFSNYLEASANQDLVETKQESKNDKWRSLYDKYN